jgi:hypothetical protein
MPQRGTIQPAHEHRGFARVRASRREKEIGARGTRRQASLSQYADAQRQRPKLSAATRECCESDTLRLRISRSVRAMIHIPHPFSWIYEGFSRSALKRNLTRPCRSIPGLFSLPLPDVMTGMSPLANLRTDESGRPLSSPSWPPPYGPAPSISVCYGAFGSCACPPHLMRYSEAL